MKTLVFIYLTLFVLSSYCQSCTSDAECGSNGYCEKAVGQCDAMGQCTKIQEICTEQYDPVCGCDGETYPNSCFARSSIDHEGTCEKKKSCFTNEECDSGLFCAKDDCSEEGICSLMPEFCTMIYQPVCGCDGKMYGNSCSAASAGQSVSSDSSCLAPKDTCLENSDCQSGHFCSRDNTCGGNGSCEVIPEFCAEYYSRTCGCDGQVYSSRCDAHSNGVSVVPCPDDNSSTIVTFTIALLIICAIWLI